jgi:hypothetical protein
MGKTTLRVATTLLPTLVESSAKENHSFFSVEKEKEHTYGRQSEPSFTP